MAAVVMKQNPLPERRLKRRRERLTKVVNLLRGVRPLSVRGEELEDDLHDGFDGIEREGCEFDEHVVDSTAQSLPCHGERGGESE